MKIAVVEKKVTPVDITTLSVGDVFCLYSDIQKYLDKKVRSYYMVTTRNGHRGYYNVNNGQNKPFNTDCRVVKVDCSLMIYDTIE